MANCYSCGHPLGDLKIYKTTLCPSCQKELKVCLMCEFYSPGAHWSCRESIDELVKDKKRANFCGFFRLNQKAGPGEKKKDSGKDAFDKLFG